MAEPAEPKDGGPGPGWCAVPRKGKPDGHGSLYTYEVETSGVRYWTRQKGPIRICVEDLTGRLFKEALRRGNWKAK